MRLKKITAVLVAATFALSSLTACGSKKGVDDNTSKADQKVQTATEAAKELETITVAASATPQSEIIED